MKPEYLAITLVNQSQGIIIVLGIVFFIIGFISALLLRRNSIWSLRRVPYFVRYSMILFTCSVLIFFWLGIFWAMKNGLLFLLISVNGVAVGALGYACGTFAHARSINSYGFGNRAWMALIPIFNIILLCKPPIYKETPKFKTNILKDIFGLSIGILLLALTNYNILVYSQIFEIIKKENALDNHLYDKTIEAMLETSGLEAILKEMVKNAFPRRIDEITTLISIEANGATLRYVYQIETDATILPDSLRFGLIKKNCSSPAFSRLLNAGAKAEYVYVHLDGTEIGAVTITESTCGNSQ